MADKIVQLTNKDGDNLFPISAGSISMQGATATEAGKAGSVPAPVAGDQDKFLKGDGTWVEVEADGDDSSYYAEGAWTAQNDCVFLLKDYKDSSSERRRVQKKIFLSSMTDPITNNTVSGKMETIELVSPENILYIEQIFTSYDNTKVFKRRADLASYSSYTTVSALATALASRWHAWYPYKYPVVTGSAAGIQYGAIVTNGSIRLKISGGVAVFNFYDFRVSSNSGTIATANWLSALASPANYSVVKTTAVSSYGAMVNVSGSGFYIYGASSGSTYYGSVAVPLDD